MIVMTAVTSQAAMRSAGDPTPRAISAGTMKMPEPIIDPITMAVAEKRPKPFTKVVRSGAAVCDCSIATKLPDSGAFVALNLPAANHAEELLRAPCYVSVKQRGNHSYRVGSCIQNASGVEQRNSTYADERLPR